jgi:hypothetical protein
MIPEFSILYRLVGQHTNTKYSHKYRAKINKYQPWKLRTNHSPQHKYHKIAIQIRGQKRRGRIFFSLGFWYLLYSLKVLHGGLLRNTVFCLLNKKNLTIIFLNFVIQIPTLDPDSDRKPGTGSTFNVSGSTTIEQKLSINHMTIGKLNCGMKCISRDKGLCCISGPSLTTYRYEEKIQHRVQKHYFTYNKKRPANRFSGFILQFCVPSHGVLRNYTDKTKILLHNM